MQFDAEITRAHIDRLRKGFRAGTWLCPLIFAASGVLHALRGGPFPLGLLITGGLLWLLLLLSRIFIKGTTRYPRVLAFGAAVALSAFACVFAGVGATGGAISPSVNSYLFAVAGTAFLLPLHPTGILLLYPAAFLGHTLVIWLSTDPSVPRSTVAYAINSAFWGTVLCALGTWYYFRTLQEAFTWRSALREEARRADLGLERARIARDLHDHIGARLTGIALRAEREQRRLPMDAHPTLAWIQDTVRLCLEELRDTIWALSNSGRDARELVATLRRRAEDIADAAGLELIWQIDDEVWNGTLSPGVSVALSAILREALTNTIRHSGAKHVTVLLERRESVIRMEVSDDGRGMGEHPNEGRGLNNMRSRAKEQHGDVDIVPNGDAGVKVVAEIPWREDLLQDRKAA